MDTKRIVFSGSGGQGVITAAIILGEAATVCEHLNAVQSQVYGPEARGGATRADVVISQEAIYYPKVINPNYLICLTQKAYNKYSNIVRPEGLLLVDSRLVTINEKVDTSQLALPLYETLMAQIGKSVVFNICVLGALVALTELIKPSSIIETLHHRMPPRTWQINQDAFDLGLELGGEGLGAWRREEEDL